MRTFISHSSEHAAFAARVERVLRAARIGVWLDRSKIRLGVLLRKELQEAIDGARVVVLLWSKPAARSRWVASELLTAFHLGRFIVPCCLDGTRLPRFLEKSVHLDFRRNRKQALEELCRAVKRAPHGANEFLAPMISRSPELNQTIDTVRKGQNLELRALTRRDLDSARKTHEVIDEVMRKAEKKWRLDPLILNLAGFHRKNAYMLKHWDAVQAGRARRDPLLARAERLFFETLFLDPGDHSALDGIASVLMLEGETEAALFFDTRAIEVASSKGLDYKEAKQNLKLIEWFRSGDRRPGASPKNPAKLDRPQPGRIDDPGQARRHFSRGRMLFAGEDYAGAVREYDQGLALAPYDAQAHWQRGASLVYLNQFEEGLRAIERALEIEPSLVEAHSARGAVLVGLGRYEEGLREINCVLAVCPGDPQATTTRPAPVPGGETRRRRSNFWNTRSRQTRSIERWRGRILTSTPCGCMPRWVRAFAPWWAPNKGRDCHAGLAARSWQPA